MSLRLTDSVATTTGVVIATYEPARDSTGRALPARLRERVRYAASNGQTWQFSGEGTDLQPSRVSREAQSRRAPPDQARPKTIYL